jgi:hypothetical protein
MYVLGLTVVVGNKNSLRLALKSWLGQRVGVVFVLIVLPKHLFHVWEVRL